MLIVVMLALPMIACFSFAMTSCPERTSYKPRNCIVDHNPFILVPPSLHSPFFFFVFALQWLVRLCSHRANSNSLYRVPADVSRFTEVNVVVVNDYSLTFMLASTLILLQEVFDLLLWYLCIQKKKKKKVNAKPNPVYCNTVYKFAKRKKTQNDVVCKLKQGRNH